MYVVFCIVDEDSSLMSDNHEDLLRSTEYDIEIENTNAQELRRRRSALRHYATWPTNKYPI
ncbi:uncharacterized protein N7487_004175 [Penicillium crustosum]|uniref:uncharacterized protein n=1 Tax=Penicillium crustosum TaxID=36656 RepID=UPI0023A3615E|nr:uncharacterized protein N7487_004175 [Penicillium crustosum]KAJ5409816.1 hypothetical protein N7487_004175 [Penicillium crustosum]